MEKNLDYLVVIEQDEDGVYVATVPARWGCHTQARRLEELFPRIREAIELCLEVEGTEASPMRFIGIHQIEVAA